jgi:hypothetical protein
MAAAVETGFKPDSHNVKRQIFRDQALANGKNIGVIMLSR